MKKVFTLPALYALLAVLLHSSLGAMDLTKTAPDLTSRKRGQEEIYREDQDVAKRIAKEPKESSPHHEVKKEEQGSLIALLRENKELSHSSKTPRNEQEGNMAQARQGEPQEKKVSAPDLTNEEKELSKELSNVIKEDNCHLLETMLNTSQITISMVNKHKDTLLHLTAGLGAAQCLKLLLDRGIEKEARNIFGMTALHVASLRGRSNCLMILLEIFRRDYVLNKSHALINQIDLKGRTPLDLAINDCIPVLRARNAMRFSDMEPVNKVRFALCHGKEACIALLRTLRLDPNKKSSIGHGAGEILPALHHALSIIKYEKIQAIAEVLLALGANIETRNDKDDTYLHIACKKKNDGAVALLLAHEAQTDSVNIDGETPLHIACREGSTECIVHLLNKNANPSATNKEGLTPLHIACQNKNDGTVTLLLAKMPEELITKTDSQGNTPLHYAADAGSEESLKILLEHGANREAINNDGERALEKAKKEDRFICMKLLMDPTDHPLTKPSVPFKIKLSQGNLVTVPAEIESFSTLLSSARSLLTEKDEPRHEGTEFISPRTWNHIIELSPWLSVIELNHVKENETGRTRKEFDKVARKLTQSYSSQDIQNIMHATNFLQIDCLLYLAQTAYGRTFIPEALANIYSLPAELVEWTLGGLIDSMRDTLKKYDKHDL